MGNRRIRHARPARVAEQLRMRARGGASGRRSFHPCRARAESDLRTAPRPLALFPRQISQAPFRLTCRIRACCQREACRSGGEAMRRARNKRPRYPLLPCKRLYNQWRRNMGLPKKTAFALKAAKTVITRSEVSRVGKEGVSKCNTQVL